MSTLPTRNKISCRCSLCGELLTCPIEFEGNIYGWSCIMKVNPSARKSKEKVLWVEALGYAIEPIINNYYTLEDKAFLVKATLNKYYFSGAIKSKEFVTKHHSSYRKDILIQDGKAFINILAFNCDIQDYQPKNGNATN